MNRLKQNMCLAMMAVAFTWTTVAIGQDHLLTQNSSGGLEEAQGSVHELIEAISSPSLSIPRRSRTASLVLADLTISELREFVHQQQLFSLFARWELNRRVAEAKMVESGDDSVKLSAEFMDAFFGATEKLYRTRIPDRWKHLVSSSELKSNGSVDLTPGFLSDRVDRRSDFRTELDAGKSTLVVTSGERQVKVRGADDLWLIDYIAASDHSEHLIVLIPTLPDLSLLVASISPGDTVEAAELTKIKTNWVRPRVGLLECFPMSTNDDELVVFYATYQQFGIVAIDLTTGQPHNHFCSSTRFVLVR